MEVQAGLFGQAAEAGQEVEPAGHVLRVACGNELGDEREAGGVEFLVPALTHRVLVVELGHLGEDLDAEVLLAHPGVRLSLLAAQIGLPLLHLEGRPQEGGAGAQGALCARHLPLAPRAATRAVLSARLQRDLLDEREEGESKAGHRVKVLGVGALSLRADTVARDSFAATQIGGVSYPILICYFKRLKVDKQVLRLLPCLPGPNVSISTRSFGYARVR